MELHPLLVMFGVFAAQIGGIPGSFLSVPISGDCAHLYLRLKGAQGR